MKLSESPIITFIRGITLLATLIAVPGIAIFWNLLPKNFAKESVLQPVPSKVEKTQILRKDSNQSMGSVSMFAPGSIDSPLPEVQEGPTIPLPAPADISDATIRQVSWEYSMESSQNFEALELRLKSLGATYYQLQKWGNRGDLFRFSCYVTPLENCAYEKYFQAIDTDAVAAMRSVIAEIEQWKNPVR